jgi:DNA-binding FadR family transcriptional regulator
MPRSATAPPKPRVTVDQAVVRLRRRLQAQRKAPQQRLDPERVLAPVIGCSRATLRAALDRLEREGLLWRHVGQGTFMGPRPRQELIRPLVLFEMASPGDLMQARLVIEPPIAAAAATAATADDVSRLRTLARQSCEAASWQDYELIDDAFHKAIAAATANRLLMAVLGTLSSVRGRSRWQRQHDTVFRRARKHEYALAQGAMHLAIADAIAARKPAVAQAKMREHLTNITELVIANRSDR